MSQPRPIENEQHREKMVYQVVEQVARYRLSVFASLERLPAFLDYGPREVRQVVQECERRQLIGSALLHANLRYWHLLAAGAEAFRCSEERIGPLSEPAKLRAFALLRFCCLSDTSRHHLAPDELRQHFPDLARPGLPNAYYFDPSGVGRLGFARIDAGRRGRWDRTLQSVQADMREHLAQAGFRRLIHAGRFEITVLTVFRQKAQRIHEALAKQVRGPCVPVNVVALPELLPLVISCP
ncbi:MAG: hypothetical protein J0M17_09100 [Planctomycetes bacterium]|jgi:hypothetical protein|nr:hypothetical protein [Planctomycetota bacterium]